MFLGQEYVAYYMCGLEFGSYCPLYADSGYHSANIYLLLTERQHDSTLTEAHETITAYLTAVSMWGS
jgi:hypothetical protein